MKHLVVILASFAVLSANAQPGSGYVRDAYEKKYENENAANKQKGMDWMNNAMNGKTEAAYTFNTMVNMHVTTYKDGEKNKENDMKYYLHEGELYFGMKAEDERRKKDDMFIIYDNKNNSMIMLNEGEKTGMAMNINAFMSADAQARRGQPKEGGTNTNKCNRTGKTKTILGRNCFEYVCVDEDRNRRSEFWITTDIKVDISKSFMRGPYAGFSHDGGGFMMEATIYKNNQIESKLEVTQLDTHADVSKKIADYKMGMH
ncbi:MAG: hypothetical protein JST82_05195 [Bacteroidetes bacterium]|nr:hypothetical protein [Bacteroidota bacterium]